MFLYFSSICSYIFTYFLFVSVSLSPFPQTTKPIPTVLTFDRWPSSRHRPMRPRQPRALVLPKSRPSFSRRRSCHCWWLLKSSVSCSNWCLRGFLSVKVVHVCASELGKQMHFGLISLRCGFYNSNRLSDSNENEHVNATNKKTVKFNKLRCDWQCCKLYPALDGRSYNQLNFALHSESTWFDRTCRQLHSSHMRVEVSVVTSVRNFVRLCLNLIALYTLVGQ